MKLLKRIIALILGSLLISGLVFAQLVINVGVCGDFIC